LRFLAAWYTNNGKPPTLSKFAMMITTKPISTNTAAFATSVKFVRTNEENPGNDDDWTTELKAGPKETKAPPTMIKTPKNVRTPRMMLKRKDFGYFKTKLNMSLIVSVDKLIFT
jgi:hypothetical protein